MVRYVQDGMHVQYSLCLYMFVLWHGKTHQYLNISTPPRSSEFDEPDPKQVRMILNLELPVLDKLDKAFNFFQTQGWNTNDFLHHLFVSATSLMWSEWHPGHYYRSQTTTKS